MNRTILVFLLLVSALVPAFAETVIADGSNVSGSWTKDNSPYHVMGVVTVPYGQTLTIEPGTVVMFRADTVNQREQEEFGNGSFKLGMLRVRGLLIAKGTPEERILFTRLEQEDLKEAVWGTIQVCAVSGKSEFVHCNFEYANGVIEVPTGESEVKENATGALSFIECAGLVENCLFRLNWAGINAKHGSVLDIKYCTIVENKYSIEANEDSRIKARGCLFYDNIDGFFVNDRNDLELSYSFVQNGQWDDNIYDAQNNVRKGDNPKFNNPKKGDYSLSKKSPCLAKGEKGKNVGAF
jgi:hypothetical protein